jgi:hypothetical protein
MGGERSRQRPGQHGHHGDGPKAGRSRWLPQSATSDAQGDKWDGRPDGSRRGGDSRKGDRPVVAPLGARTRADTVPAQASECRAILSPSTPKRCRLPATHSYGRAYSLLHPHPVQQHKPTGRAGGHANRTPTPAPGGKPGLRLQRKREHAARTGIRTVTILGIETEPSSDGAVAQTRTR